MTTKNELRDEFKRLVTAFEGEQKPERLLQLKDQLLIKLIQFKMIDLFHVEDEGE